MPRPKSKPKPRVLLTFTGFRRKLDRITDTLWAGGVTNPVT